MVWLRSAAGAGRSTPSTASTHRVPNDTTSPSRFCAVRRVTAKCGGEMLSPKEGSSLTKCTAAAAAPPAGRQLRPAAAVPACAAAALASSRCRCRRRRHARCANSEGWGAAASQREWLGQHAGAKPAAASPAPPALRIGCCGLTASMTACALRAQFPAARLPTLCQRSLRDARLAWNATRSWGRCEVV